MESDFGMEQTRTEEKSNTHQRAFNPIHYEIGGDQYPFFLAMVAEKFQNDEPWFFSRPLGKNLPRQFLSKATPSNWSTSKNKVSNHSARKTTITTLLDNNVNLLHVSQLSGYKNVGNHIILRHYNNNSPCQT